jgi:hypothetical protein
LATLAFLGGVLLLAGLAWAAAWNLLWEDVFDFAASEDIPRDMVQSGRVLLTVGSAEDGLGGSGFQVRATDALDGSLLWDDRLEFPGGSLGGAFRVAIHGARAFVTGEGDDVAGDHLLVVRAYRLKTGDLLWEDSLAVGGRFIFPPVVATDGRRVFISSRRMYPSGDRDTLVRTHDARTGSLLWETQLDRGGDDFAVDLAVQGDRVFVCGGAATAPFPVHTDFSMRALDAKTGALVWEDFYDFDGHLDQARGIALGRGRVYATGFGRHPGADDDIVVRSYDAETGAPLWTETFDGDGGSDFAPSIFALKSRVFVAGWTADAEANTDFLVRAHDAETGALLWQDLSDGPGDFDWARDLAGRGRFLVAVGQSGFQGGGLDEVVRVYDAKTGAVVWEDRFGPPDQDGSGARVVIGKSLYVAGVIRESSSPDADWVIRAYERDGGHQGGFR